MCSHWHEFVGVHIYECNEHRHKIYMPLLPRRLSALVRPKCMETYSTVTAYNVIRIFIFSFAMKFKAFFAQYLAINGRKGSWAVCTTAQLCTMHVPCMFVSYLLWQQAHCTHCITVCLHIPPCTVMCVYYSSVWRKLNALCCSNKFPFVRHSMMAMSRLCCAVPISSECNILLVGLWGFDFAGD